MEISLDKILNSRYKVHLDTICEALDAIGYRVNKDTGGLSAIKIIDNYRFHLIITNLPNGEVDRFCWINLHKDIGTGLFHPTIKNDEDIDNELDSFSETLSKIIKRKRHNFKRRLKYYKNLEKKEKNSIGNFR